MMPNISILQIYINSLQLTDTLLMSTKQAIQFHNGQFVSNLHTPPSKSSNARFGRFLSRHQNELSIRFAGTVRVEDENGHHTHSAMWAIRRTEDALNPDTPTS